CGPATRTARCRLDAVTPTTLVIPAASLGNSSSPSAVPAHASGGRSAQNSMVRRQRRCSTPTPAIRPLQVKLHPIQTTAFSSLLPFHFLEFAECLQMRHLIQASLLPPTQTRHQAPQAR